ncbi:MAG: methyl-accepting chemotaxis protein [Nitrospinae bacterium]|nr:methyl-accepting chemotaxis protein [Nitrospinota bacterium]
MKEKMDVKRRQHFIKKRFQARFIAKFILLILLGSAVSGIILYVMAGSKLGATYYSAHVKIENTWDILFPAIVTTNIVTVILISLATVYITLFVSHKIAGPLFKFEKLMKEVGEGKLNVKPSLREADELVELSNAFGDMLTGLNNKIKEIKKHSQAARTTLDKISISGGEEAVKKAKEEICNLQRILEQFQIEEQKT